MKLNYHIIAAEINTAIMSSLLEYQKSGNISNENMYLALQEIAESFKTKDIIKKYKEKL